MQITLINREHLVPGSFWDTRLADMSMSFPILTLTSYRTVASFFTTSTPEVS